jgi:hypothetical protein
MSKKRCLHGPDLKARVGSEAMKDPVQLRAQLLANVSQEIFHAGRFE